MNIRRLGPTDAAGYRTLRLSALREFPQAFTSSYEEDEKLPAEASGKRLGSEHNKFWGAFDGDELCGMVGLECEARAKNRHKATVVGMYVRSERTGRGIGAALMKALIDEARASRLELLVLTVTVTEGDSAALRLYERCGFRSFGVEPRAIKVEGRAYAKNHMYLNL